MINNRYKTIYYISDLVNGYIYIVDDNYSIIKKINIGPRPQNIIVDEEKNIYIASDRNSKVTLIKDLYDISREFHIPNSGNAEVDCISRRIYISNTDEIDIYSLNDGKKVGNIKGFMAADCLCMNKDKKKLFILDILQNEIKVYDTVDLKLINIYKNVGIAPCYILLSKNEEEMYIADKGAVRRNMPANISILNLEDGSNSLINLSKGSIITYLEENGNTLYAVNSGLHRIEIIDKVSRRSIESITTSLPDIQRVKLCRENNILIATSTNSEGKGSISKIDTLTNRVIDTFIFKEDNIVPFDIGVVTEKILQIEEKSKSPQVDEDKSNEEKGISILAKKVLSTYEEKVIFDDAAIDLSFKNEAETQVQEIKFEKCIVDSETENIADIEDISDYILLEYNFKIPYKIKCRYGENENYIIQGSLEGKQKASLHVPAYAEQQGVEYKTTSFAKVTKPPVIVDKKLIFSVEAEVYTRVITEEVVFIPEGRNLKERRSEDE